MKLTLPLLASAALLFGATGLHAVEAPGASEPGPAELPAIPRPPP
jgi:hypothetical protein